MAVVTEHIGFDFERVFHRKHRAAAADAALVADLAAALGVKRCVVQHHHTGLPGLHFFHGHAVHIQGRDLGFGAQVFVADEFVADTGVFQRPVHFEFTGSAGLGFLFFHRGVETGFVDGHISLAAHIVGQVQRKTVGIVQFECNFTRKHMDTLRQTGIQDFHAGCQGLIKPLFLSFEYRSNAISLRRQIRISLAHQRDQVGNEFVEKRFLLTQLVAVANRATDDAPLHIAASFAAGNHAVADQKCGGAYVVGDDAQRVVVHIGTAGFARSGLDQRIKNIDLVVAVHMLQDGGQALQAHAGVHARRWQFVQTAVRLHIELHEHMVPDFNETVAVFVRAAGRAAGNVRAVVVKNLGARAARAGVGHHPKIV